MNKQILNEIISTKRKEIKIWGPQIKTISTVIITFIPTGKDWNCFGNRI